MSILSYVGYGAVVIAVLAAGTMLLPRNVLVQRSGSVAATPQAILTLADITPNLAFQPLEATRAHLLSKLGRRDEAIAAYDTAVSLTIEPATRTWLLTKRAALA